MFIIPNIIACALLIFFVVLFIIKLLIQLFFYNIILDFHTTYNRYLVLLHISLCLIAILNSFIIFTIHDFKSSEDKGLLGIRVFLIFLPFFVLTFSSKIV